MEPSPRRLRLALQKRGRLAEASEELLRAVHIAFDRHQPQAPLVQCRGLPLDLLFVRDDEIPEYVERGVCDIGIVGENLLVELGSPAVVLERLGFGACSLVLAVPNGSAMDSPEDLAGRRVATSYPSTTQRWLRSHGIEAEMVPISGAVEITPALGIADAVSDLTQTGTTLRLTGLRPLATILESEALLVAAPEVAAKPGPVLENLRLRIQSAVAARGCKYLMMNAPASALERIRAELPALSSPTVLPLADTGQIAIHSVVPERELWPIVERLRAAGASGILITAVEGLLP
jgi:ATP phosphoribosyltransferase